jgi:hypothetical protein
MMGDMDMGELMSMGMMMPPNMMDGVMPMGGMPNPMMGLPMGMNPPIPSSGPGGSPAMRNNRGGNFNNRGGSSRNMQMGRSKNSDNKERDNGDM